MANEKRLDLIDRSELAKDIAQIGFVTVGNVLQCLSDAKRVDAVEVVHGRWEWVDDEVVQTPKQNSVSSRPNIV